MKYKKFVSLSSLCVLLGTATAVELADKTLRVEIQNLRNERGDVGCGLFNSADGFPESADKALQSAHVQIDGNKAVCEFRSLVPGTYAVIVFHDENNNGRVDKNLLGIPKEGYGTSNDVRPAMAAPEFKPASFVLGGDKLTRLTVQMRY